MKLSDAELAAYRRDGYLVREGVFSEGELPALRQAVEDAVALACQQALAGRTYWLDGKRFVDVGGMTVQFEPGPDSDTVRVIEPAQHLHPGLAAVVRDSRVLQPVRGLLGRDDLAVWTNKLNLKRPQEGSGFGWHQDSPYWVHDCDHVDLLPNVYLAFDDAGLDNGCLGIIRGSHTKGCLPGTDDGTQLGGFFTAPHAFCEQDAVWLAVPAGSLVFFDPHAIHGSKPNHSARPRRAMVMTYQPAGFPMLKTGEVCNL